MQNTFLTSVACLVLITACGTSKKTTSALPTTNSGKPRLSTDSMRSSTIVGPLAPSPMIAAPRAGVVNPGETQLAAIQLTHKAVTLQTLQEGYSIYTGACTKCHGAFNIYNHSEERWSRIIDEMAPNARLSPAQKDAVYMYVLSVKASQAK